jgi:hypothetical protein
MAELLSKVLRLGLLLFERASDGSPKLFLDDLIDIELINWQQGIYLLF